MIHTETMPMTNSGTLEHLLSDGRLSVADALGLAMRVAESLRRLHDSGQVHGALTPASILVGQGGVELLPFHGDAGAITPYTAPELLEGRSADSRSDIFSFGAIL